MYLPNHVVIQVRFTTHEKMHDPLTLDRKELFYDYEQKSVANSSHRVNQIGANLYQMFYWMCKYGTQKED